VFCRFLLFATVFVTYAIMAEENNDEDIDIKDLNILVIGTTGSGKSQLIKNTFGVKKLSVFDQKSVEDCRLDDDDLAQIVVDGFESGTKDIKIYQTTKRDGKSLYRINWIDTKGLKDSKGGMVLMKDVFDNAKKMGMIYVNLILVCIKYNRYMATMRSEYQEVQYITKYFDKSIVKVVITNCEGLSLDAENELISKIRESQLEEFIKDYDITITGTRNDLVLDEDTKIINKKYVEKHQQKMKKLLFDAKYKTRFAMKEEGICLIM